MRRGAVLLTIVISAVLHVVVATGLVAVAKNKEVRRRAISVAVQDEKKKEKPKPPPPPKPIVKAAPPKPAAPTPVAAAPVHAAAHAAPVAMNLAMGNTAGGGGLDIGPGIGLHGRAEPAAAAAPTKTASAISESRLRKAKEESGGGAEAPCEEEPTKPEAVVKTELNYSLRPQAQADGVEGKFKARVIVAANGEVSDVEVVTSIEPAFDAALVAALKTWRFKPAMACGKPVAGGTFVISRTFELGD